MNANIFRLVFNKKLGMYVPAHEAVRSHGKGGRASVSASAATALMLVATLASARPAVTTPAATALPKPAANFVSSGSGSHSTLNNAMTVIQTTPTLGLNWNSFNIGSAASVTFNQPNAAARVLNRIGSSDPSVIMGQLNANGQVYLINPNGILFGNGAQVNVGGLVASALNGVTDDLLNKGLPSAVGDKLGFAWEGNALGFANGFVAVDPGASITTASGSRVVLLAPKTVENLGHIETGAGGEAILAAGGSVLLTAPSDPNLRGLLVEVKSWKGVDALGGSVSLDGKVTNKTSDKLLKEDGSIDPDSIADPNSGKITAPTGVLTLAALAVNQEGTVKAGKAINLNGEIMLVAGATEAPRLTVTQTADKAEIDWKSGFSLAQGQTVEFVQPTTGAVAYNFVYDPDRIAADGSALDQAGRSSIDGVLKANGQLFVINEKGIDFGSHAVVTAANFVASALGAHPDIVATGLFSQDGVSSRAFYLNKDQWVAATEADFDTTRDAALAAFRESTVNVAAGAKITTAENGFAILAGGRVNQAGTITTPGGQALLAAGADLYLKPPYSQVLRGFTAEVNPLYVVQGWTSDNLWQDISRGADVNKVTNTGTVHSPFGNITLVGYEIEQAGSLRASTSVTRNGSIRLLARDQVASQGVGDEPPVDSAARKRNTSTGQIVATGADVSNTEDEVFTVGRLGGTLTLTKGSVTEVELDGGDHGTITADQALLLSNIEASAAQIYVEGNTAGQAGAAVSAKGGRILLTASELFDVTTAFPQDPIAVSIGTSPSADVGVFIGTGAKLDASGAIAAKSVADLFIEVELRGDELANNPTQRDGSLRGKTAWVDIRDKVAIADLSGYINKAGQTLEERTATGGEITLRSGGSLIVKQDAVLDVSGGRVDYAAGVVKESKVVANTSKNYRLNDAPIDLAYAGLRTSERNEAAYTEGKSAGSVELTGHSIALDGTLLGKTVRGARQRNLGDPATDRYSVPKGAKLVVRDAGQHFQPVGAGEADKAAAYSQAQIAFVAGRSSSANGLNFGDSAGPKLEISRSLVDAGFSRFDIRSDGRIDIPDGMTLNLAAGGEFKASGRQVFVGGEISAPSGSISLTTRDLNALLTGLASETAKYSTLVVDETAKVSTAGRWINDLRDLIPAAQSPKAINGGSITLDSAYDLVLETGSILDVSGGARLKLDSKVEAGNAGSIILSTGRFGLAEATDQQDSSLFLDGTLSAYALGKGGKLEINTSQIRFGDVLAEASPEWSRADRLVSANNNDPTDLRRGAVTFSADILNQGGFFDFKFTGRDGLTVADDVALAPNPLSWSLLGVPGYQLRASGSAIADFAKSLQLHSDLRTAPTSLSLATRSVPYGDLTIGDGAHLKVDPTGSIILESWRQMTVLGTLEARGGNILMTRPASTFSNGKEGMLYTPELQSSSIFLGGNSKLLAGGVTKLDAATRAALDSGSSATALHSLGLYRGEVLSGGRVDLDAGQGYLITRPGSQIDVSGSVDTINTASPGGQGVIYRPTRVASSGGKVGLSAREGMFLDGGYTAAGAEGAVGGDFSLRFADPRSDIDPWYTSELSELSAVEDALKRPRLLTLYQSTGEHAELWPAGITEIEYLNGSAILDPVVFNGKARLDLAPLAGAGFGSWYLASQDQIGFEGVITAAVANQLRLDSPAFTAHSDAANISLKAAAIQIGSYGSQIAATPATGSASFSATARDIAVVGNFSWSGFNSTQFVSSGELHFDGMPHGIKVGGVTRTVFDGVLKGTGLVEFSASRLSPSTYSDFVVDLSSDSGAAIKITRPDPNKVKVDSLNPLLLSAGGSLEFKAQSIEHHGTILAPLGQVVFNAPGGSVTLGADSSTSVSAIAALPLGQTSQSGRLWDFVASYWNPGSGNLVTTAVSVIAPEKAVLIDAANSKVEAGAVIDLSGSGEAVAWEFSPGPGGKTDILALTSGQEPGVFAILPGWSGNFAPSDSQNQAGYNVSNPQTVGTSIVYDAIPSLKPGDQIDLATNPTGLSGRYTLLPARYALMPGAVLVSVKTTQDATVARPIAQADGSWLVSGTRLAAIADGGFAAYSQRPLTLELAPQAVIRDRARYIETTASSFFYDQPGVQLPGDAGRLSVAGRTKLGFDPVVLGQRAAQIASGDGRARAGRGIELDLAAPQIEVVDAGTSASGIGWTTFDKAKLNDLGVSSLLLGGLRTVDGGTSSIQTISTDLRIATSVSDPANDKDALQAPEILLTATDKVSIEAGSLVAANGDAPAQDFVLTGDGAFARIAGGKQAGLERKGAVTRSQGDLNLATGATLKGRALIFDATHANTLSGSVKLHNLGSVATDGGALAIGANRINVVGDGSTPLDGLTLSNAAIAGFGSPDQLRLTSYSTLDFYGQATLGTATLKELVIAAAGLAGHGTAATTARILGESVRFENPNPDSAAFVAGAALGAGGLEVTAQTVRFGDNATQAMRDAEQSGFALRGFADVTVTASEEVRFEGLGVTRVDNNDGDGATIDALAKLTLDTGRVVVSSAADHVLVASGMGEVKGGGNAATSTDQGGRFDLRADSLVIGGRVLAPAGSLAFTATGTDKDVSVKTGAVIAADGAAVTFADTQAYAPGGKIVLKSKLGDVTVESGATVSVTAHPVGGDAGQVSLIAQFGTVSAAANTLRGAASSDYNQGELSVDADVVDLNGLAAAVRETQPNGDTLNHFAGRWDIRRRNGALNLTDSVVAQRVSLAADNGSISIGDATHAGKIDASGPKGGEIELFARNGDVVLGEKGQLLARGETLIDNLNNAGTRGRGGRVTLGASGTGSKVVTKSGSQIDVGVAVGSQAQGGKVVFRANESASIATKTDLNIQLAGAVAGASNVSAEIVRHFTGTALNAASTSGMTLGLSSIKSGLDTAYNAANMATLRAHLGFNDAKYHVRPGVEITTPTGSVSDFTISGDLNFSQLRFPDASGSLTEAGFLTIRAPRDLKINRVVSDGFSENLQTGSNSLARDAALSPGGDSWTYRFVSGADLLAGNPLATLEAPISGATAATDPIALKGSIEVATQKIVRTGSGDITFAARRDIKLFEKAAVYTAGYTDNTHPENFVAYDSWSSFPANGGDIKLSAGQRILMVKNTSGSAETTPTQRHVNEWLRRVGATSGTFNHTQWWPNIAAFQQGFAAFGGGDISLIAGTDIKNVTVAIPTSGRIPGTEELGPQLGLARIEGGGNLTARAGGSIEGGLFYAESGEMRIEAGKEVKSNTAFALGNTNLDIVAGTGIALGDVFNPLWVKQKYVQTNGTPGNAEGTEVQPEESVRIGTYNENSSLHVLSLSGNIGLNANGSYGGVKDPTISLQRVAPGRVWVAALNGNISGSLMQAPDTNGQLDLLAGGSIAIGTNGIQQFDTPANLLPSVQSPKSEEDVDLTLLFKSALAPTKSHTASPWHIDDLEPSRLIALNGDVSGASAKSQSNSQFNEAVIVSAAGDVRDLSITAQHLRTEDVTRVSAAGDISFTISSVINTGKFQVNGPGKLEILAGGDVDLGAAGGIITRGNLENPYLPEVGASVYVLAGATPNYAGLRGFLKVGDGVGEAELRDRFYQYLRDKGREALAGGGEASYEIGRDAIQAFFPNDSINGGDIDFFYSQIKTEQGGNIDLLAPGGGITVGIANPSKSLNKKAAEQGLFTIRGGDIRAMVRDDFLVNQSRVFTLDGGDILIWADQGSIDAGSGAKTVSATPPPVLVIRNGQIVLDTSGSVSGSGIGALASRPDTPASDLDLFAPQGAIDAGDAGLRSTGDVFLGATTILNSTNIQVGGVSTGVPIATSSVTGFSGASTPSEATASADDVTKSMGEGALQDSQAVQEMKQALASFKPTFISVEVLGYGSGTGSVDDAMDGAEELKREEEQRRRGSRQGA